MECGRIWAELEHLIPTVGFVLRNLRRIGRLITFRNYDSSMNVHSICHDGTVCSVPITQQSIVAILITHILIKSTTKWTLKFLTL